MKDADRSVAIDCLRALAVLWVFYYHFSQISIFSHGTNGVLLFFVISGYCIAFSIETSKSAWHFYAKRLGRLLPALIVCGFLTTAFKAYAPQLIDPARLSGWRDYLCTMGLVPTLNFPRIDFQPPDWAYWSLGIEFQFYFICFLIVLIGLRHRLVPVLSAIVVFRALTTGIDQVNSNDFFPFFLAGLSIAAAIEGRATEALIGFVTAAIVDLYYLGLHFHEPSAPIGVQRSVFLWVATALVYFAARHVPRLPIERRVLTPLAFIGVVSYPLYLIHQDVGNMLLTAFAVPGSTFYARIVRLLVLPGFFIVVAAVIFYGIERPWIKPLTSFLSKPSLLRRYRSTQV